MLHDCHPESTQIQIDNDKSESKWSQPQPTECMTRIVSQPDSLVLCWSGGSELFIPFHSLLVIFRLTSLWLDFFSVLIVEMHKMTLFLCFLFYLCAKKTTQHKSSQSEWSHSGAGKPWLALRHNASWALRVSRESQPDKELVNQSDRFLILYFRFKTYRQAVKGFVWHPVQEDRKHMRGMGWKKTFFGWLSFSLLSTGLK